jgi:hypothetical protein
VEGTRASSITRPRSNSPKDQTQDIGNALMPTIMADALKTDSMGYRAYLDKVLAGAGGPTDSIEIMMIEQLVLAHFRAAQLQADAVQAQVLEAIGALNSASACLLGEFRMTALALQMYRAGRQKSGHGPEAGTAPQATHPTGKHHDQEPNTRRSRRA